MILFLGVLCFLLNLLFLYSSYKERNISFLIWVCSAFFFSFPFLVDSAYIYFGYGDIWQKYLNIQDESYSYNFYNTNMLVMASFIILFFIFFKFGNGFIKNKDLKIKINKPNQFEYIFLILNWVFMLIFLFIYPDEFFKPSFDRKTNFLYQICVLGVFLTTSSSLVYILNKKYILFLINIFPCIFISFVTAERPYLAPVIGIVFASAILSGLNDFKKIFKLFGLGVLALFLMRFVRVFAHGDSFNVFDLLISRDVSTSVLYYIFQKTEYFEGYTQGKATIFLLLTGIYPDFLLGQRVFSEVDIPGILAYERFSWNFGSIHPTMFGWVFMDLGWYGLIFAFLFGLMVAFFNKYTTTLSLRLYSIFIVAFSIFTFVGYRGSLQVGYSNAFYILILGGILYFSYKVLAKKYPVR